MVKNEASLDWPASNLQLIYKMNKHSGEEMTEISNIYRREQIAKILAAYKESGERRTLPIEYRGETKLLEVIRIDPKVLLLNPNNSRLTAQLHDHHQQKLVHDNPTSEEAQEILANLLRKTEKFSRLKEELNVLKQKEPGLISRDGLLINGNTRVVALRDIGSEGVDVAVLPEDAGNREFLDLEMSLQMRRLTHQDYTFTNGLLLMDRYKKFGHTDKQLAVRMGWLRGGQKKVDQSTQLLQLIQEIRKLTTPSLAYEVFDAKRQHLIDLNDEYQMLRQSDPRAANQMKWGRVIAMFLGVNKDQTRVIGEDFFEEDVIKRLGGNLDVSSLLDEFKKVPNNNDGLDNLFEGNYASNEELDLRSFATKVLSDLTDDAGFVSKDLTPELEVIHNVIRLGSEQSITKGKREKLLLEPSDILQETRISLESVVDSFSEVSKLKGFDANRFEYQLNKVQKSLEDLAKEFKKYVSAK